VSADRPQGRAGTGPGGPAGVGRNPFTDETGACHCDECDECPCFQQHASGICACCRVGHHDHSCGPRLEYTPRKPE
jgi:hypothetical protein